MTKPFDIEAMRRDRDEGTPGLWEWEYRNGGVGQLRSPHGAVLEDSDYEGMWFRLGHKPEGSANMCRVARVPEMEAEIERLTALLEGKGMGII